MDKVNIYISPGLWLQSAIIVSPVVHNVASNSSQGSNRELLVRVH
jgi:hypothetical protein